MNLVYGKLVELFEDEGLRRGKVCIGGAHKIVTLDLVAGAEKGDELLLCDCVAIAKVRDEAGLLENICASQSQGN